MSNFLVIIPSAEWHKEIKEVFHRGLRFAEKSRQQRSTDCLELDWVCVATFPRLNGSRCSFTRDEVAGDWALVSGTWFHHEGWGSGNESRLLKRIQETGPEKIAQELEGFFVLLFGDSKEERVVVVTDLIGSCHAYVRQFPGFCAISGSSLILASLGRWDLDATACQEFLCTGVMYEDRTFYKEVKKMASSTVYSFAEGTCQFSHVYWQPQDLAPESLDGESAIHIVSEKMINAARNLTKAFPRPLCDLTGGYDSRMIAAAFLKADVTFGTTVSGNSESQDVCVSRMIAKEFGLPTWHMSGSEKSMLTDLRKVLFLTDGEYDLVEYANIFRIHSSLMTRYDISINGSFGEVARGYWWELLFPNPAQSGKLDSEVIARKRYVVQENDHTMFPATSYADLNEHFSEIINRTNHGLWDFPQSFQMDHAYLKMRMQRWQGRIASSTNQIWPCFSPFMLRSILEPLLQIQVPFRRRNRFVSSLIYHLNPELANLPLEHGWPAAPVNWKNIHSFWPLVIYFGKKVLYRVFPHKGLSRTRTPQIDQRLFLWEDDAVRDLLDPSKMELGTIIDQALIEKFLKSSQCREFDYEAQWTKIVSMELALRHLKQLTLEVSRSSP